MNKLARFHHLKIWTTRYIKKLNLTQIRNRDQEISPQFNKVPKNRLKLIEPKN